MVDAERLDVCQGSHGSTDGMEAADHVTTFRLNNDVRLEEPFLADWAAERFGMQRARLQRCMRTLRSEPKHPRSTRTSGRMEAHKQTQETDEKDKRLLLYSATVKASGFVVPFSSRTSFTGLQLHAPVL